MTTLSRTAPAKTATFEHMSRQYDGKGWKSVPLALPKETGLALIVNGREMLTIMCTPEKLNCLVLGFLMGQGVISGMQDVISMGICADELVADVRIKGTVNGSARRVATSGCGAGVSFETDSGLEPVDSDYLFSPTQILSSVSMLLGKEKPGQPGRQHGMHASVLTDGESLIASSNDIGRHNTVDKIWGECILRKISTFDKILATTGRISSEMVTKAIKMKVPVVISLNSATDRAVELGTRFGITVIGYARSSQFQLFCGEQRIKDINSV